MPGQFSDLNTPRYQLAVEQLPRGLVPFPAPIVAHLEQEQARLGFRFDAEYARQALEDQTLAYYYEGLPVAYRSVPGGVEVLAIGFAEAAKYWRSPEEGVKVVQP
jgi:hypothetical protein